jgi:hypothetical protein
MQPTHRLPLEALEPRTLFAVFVAGNTHDGGPGSLRDAVERANANPGPDVIRLPHAHYTLTAEGAAQDADRRADLDVTDDLTIVTLGPGGSTIDAAGLDRVFDVRGADLAIEDLTLTGGRSERGGAISITGGALNVTDSVFSGNAVITSAQFSGGGAISADSSRVTVTGSEFTDNSATTTAPGDVYGGAIFLAPGSSGTITDSTFTGNEAHSPASAFGGAIGLLRATSLVVSDSLFDSNTAAGGTAFGGAIGSAVSGSVTVVDSLLQNNVAASTGFQGNDQGAGGAIFLFGTNGAIRNSQITGNLATAPRRGEGGGVYFAFGGSLMIRDSTITGNEARGTASAGGGVYILAFLPGSATADDDTEISGNTANTFPNVFGPLVVVPD